MQLVSFAIALVVLLVVLLLKKRFGVAIARELAPSAQKRRHWASVSGFRASTVSHSRHTNVQTPLGAPQTSPIAVATLVTHESSVGHDD